jgi:hypothetical protein
MKNHTTSGEGLDGFECWMKNCNTQKPGELSVGFGFFENNQNPRIGIINSGYYKDQFPEPMIFMKEPVKTGSSLGSSLIFQKVESHSYEP